MQEELKVYEFDRNKVIEQIQEFARSMQNQYSVSIDCNLPAGDEKSLNYVITLTPLNFMYERLKSETYLQSTIVFLRNLFINGLDGNLITFDQDGKLNELDIRFGSVYNNEYDTVDIVISINNIRGLDPTWVSSINGKLYVIHSNLSDLFDKESLTLREQWVNEYVLQKSAIFDTLNDVDLDKAYELFPNDDCRVIFLEVINRFNNALYLMNDGGVLKDAEYLKRVWKEESSRAFDDYKCEMYRTGNIYRAQLKNLAEREHEQMANSYARSEERYTEILKRLGELENLLDTIKEDVKEWKSM